MSSKDLEKLRSELDGIDEQLVHLLQRRAEIVLQVKETKEKENISVYAPTRERDIFERVRSLGKEGAFPVSSLERIFRAIVSATRSLMGDLSIAYCGPTEELAQKAILKQFGEDVQLQALPTAKEVVEKVKAGDAILGVLPIETEETGLVSATIRAIAEGGTTVISEIELD